MSTLEIQLKDEVTLLKSEVERLRVMVLLLKREKFGSKSERLENVDQLVFNELERESGALPDQTGESETITVSYEKKKKQGRAPKKPFPENLAREEKIIDLPESEKICPHDGTRLKEIGVERTEKLKTVPAQSTVVVAAEVSRGVSHRKKGAGLRVRSPRAVQVGLR